MRIHKTYVEGNLMKIKAIQFQGFMIVIYWQETR